MLNVSALITGYESVGDHTEFIVQISCNGDLWLISRRFSDFDQLHSRLVRQFGDLIEARLPEKQWFGRYRLDFGHAG
uniref:PX domain-containing protein n=1 Tax=Globisporangium ultimum (strain ATCC 200006 / CBS 805.95 / DAOM BR144) TaxID=431595 RepID=K3WM02_GLOUD